MNRWFWFLICAVLGVGLLFCGLLVPVHLRAVDASVLAQAGRNTPSLVETGLGLVQQKQLGAADLVLDTADRENVPARDRLAAAIEQLAKQNRSYRIWGSGEQHLEILFGTQRDTSNSTPEPFTDFVIHIQNRSRVLELLKASQRPGVQDLLRTRALTNTTIFPPSSSSAGQAYDAAVCIAGLLLEEAKLSAGLNDSLVRVARTAASGGDPAPLEQLLIDLMSLGQRLNWGQLSVLTDQVNDPETLRLLGSLIRKNERQLPILFSAVILSGRPAQVVAYLQKFGQTGVADVGIAMRYGAGGLNELVKENERLSTSPFQGKIAVDSALRARGFALTLKWFCYLAAGFFLALALHFARPRVSQLEQPLQVRGFHYAREVLFGLGFLLAVLILTEPHLAQESQRVDFPLRLRLPTVGKAIPGANPSHHKPLFYMNPTSLLTLVLFFVLQGLLYIACLVKLAEIRRQNVLPRIKLRLLENEEHLFDAGLYLGFCGTIISLILVSLGVIAPSLMAAYGSTSFGIIFVSIFKIFHLRPFKRKLLLEAEGVGQGDRYAAAASARTMPT
jgi:hypothetical protein